jgi:sucrose phosphorylase
VIEEKLKHYLQQIYPEQNADELASRIVETFWPENTARQAAGRIADNNLWSQKDSVLITYGDSILDRQHKPLDLLRDFLLDRLRGVVNSVHILPFFPFTSDDGFAVSDFEKVNPNLGAWEDITRITQDFKLMSDLVLNHVSSQGKWFVDYRQGHAPYDKFFYEGSINDDLSATVRPRTTPLLQTIETNQGERHVWCTFSHDQVDLDYTNPEVLLEMIRIIRLHLDKGIRIIRLDAVAFLWKEPGTSCIHLPQTHAIIKLLRVLADYAEEEVFLLTETNVPKAENLSYFGQRDEAHIIYNFPLPPLILHALLAGTAKHLTDWQTAMPPAPMGCSYLNFTASHDGIGMRPVEGLLPEAEIDRMVDTVVAQGGKASMRSMPDGSESIYELNSTYFDAMSKTFDGNEEHHLQRFIASQTIVMSLEGIPAFYIHAMLATPNDQDGVIKRKMNRAINRHRWDYPSLRAKLADPNSNQVKVLAALSEQLRLRSRQPAFHPNATQFTLRIDDRVFIVWRQSLDRSQSIFALHNVSAEHIDVPLDKLNLIADEHWMDLLSGQVLAEGITHLQLAPYQCCWITNRT